MLVQEIMTEEVCCGSAAMDAAKAAEIMWTKNCGSLPIVDDAGRVVGMVTDRDLFIALGTQNRRPAEMVLGETAVHELASCTPGDDVRHALRTMASKKVHRLPVVDEKGQIKGILSIDDILARSDSALKDEALRALKVISGHQARAASHSPSMPVRATA